MQKKINYDLNVAIGIRNQTFQDAGIGYPEDQRIVDFRTSIAVAADPSYCWGYYYPGEDILQVRDRQMTKKEWKIIQQGYRKYIRNIGE